MPIYSRGDLPVAPNAIVLLSVRRISAILVKLNGNIWRKAEMSVLASPGKVTELHQSRLPLDRLHGSQRSWMFRTVLLPPRENGTMWSKHKSFRESHSTQAPPSRCQTSRWTRRGIASRRGLRGAALGIAPMSTRVGEAVSSAPPSARFTSGSG